MILDDTLALTRQSKISFTFIIFDGFNLIQFKQLTLVRGLKILIQAASLQLHPGHKVGLTGANGAGKSSLFALLRGEMQLESGNMDMPAGWVIAHVA